MSSRVPQHLVESWLSAVVLPGESDARASCLKELAEYTGQSQSEVERLCQGAVDAQRDQWYESRREDEQSLVAFYNECDAYNYELLWWHALQQGDAPAWNARLLELANQYECRRYLDFGGGIGTNGILLAGSGREVTIADVSDVLQKFAKWRIERRQLQAKFLDLKTAELPDESYDMISAVDVLEHVTDPLATLEQLTRALAPGGLLVFDLIASQHDAERPFHLLRSKYPIRSRIRGMGYTFIEKFQKYLVYRKAPRSPLANQLIRGWDRLRWRTYYLLQGKWPSEYTETQSAPASASTSGSGASS